MTRAETELHIRRTLGFRDDDVIPEVDSLIKRLCRRYEYQYEVIREIKNIMRLN